MKLSLIQSLSHDSMLFFSFFFPCAVAFNVHIPHLTYLLSVAIILVTRVNVCICTKSLIPFNNISLILFKSLLNLGAVAAAATIVCIIICDDCDPPHFIISHQMNQKLLSFSFFSFYCDFFFFFHNFPSVAKGIYCCIEINIYLYKNLYLCVYCVCIK